MRGLWLEEGRAALREDLARPRPAAGEVRVRVTLAGVCATDLALRRGYMGFRGVPGHEFVGVALEGSLAGRRVVGEINAGCGRCARCRSGDPRHCPERTVLGILGRPGAFAEELALPESNLRPVPDGVPDEAAVFAEPLAAAFEVPAELALDPRWRAAVIGDGRLGLLCAHALARHGLTPEVAGRHAERAALLPAGARHRTGLFESDAGAPRAAYDLIVEASGDPAVVGRALAALSPRGTLVLKTTSERPASLDLSLAVVNELTLVGSRCGRFEPALAALADGSIPVEALVAERYPLDEGVRALDRAATPGVLKVLIDVAGDARTPQADA